MAKIKVKISSFLIIVCLVLMGILSITPNVMAGYNPIHVDPIPPENGYQHQEWKVHNPLELVDYIEWWYFKLSNAETNRNFFFAYAIINPDDDSGLKENTGAYIWTGMFYDEDTADNGNGDKVKINDKYDLSALNPAPRVDYLDVRIDYPNNYAITTDPPNPPHGGDGDDVHLVGNIRSTAIVEGTVDGAPFTLQDWSWDLTFTRNVGWTAVYNNDLSFLWEPYMMDAEVSGTVTVNGEVYDLDSDPDSNWHGYQDHNWGNPFPREWIWGGASFSTDEDPQDSEMSLVLGGAVMGIPPLGNEPALMLALNDESDPFDSRFYEWSTELGDIVSYNFDDWYLYEENGDSHQVPKHFIVSVMDPISDPERYRVDVNMYARDDIISRLPIPRPEGGVFYDFEALGAPAEIILSQWVGTDWIEMKRWSYDDPDQNVVQLWGGTEYGIDSLLPDLIITNIWAPGSLPGDVFATVKNQGDNTAADFYVDFFDSAYSGEGSEIGLWVMSPLTPQHVDSLDPGQSTTVSTEWTSPPYGGGEGGGDFLYVYADYSGNLIESNENNNVLLFIPLTGEVIDPTMSQTYIPGDSFTVDFLVINPSMDTEVISLMLDQSTVPSNWNAGLYDSMDNSITDVVLESNENTVVTLKITPSLTATGDYNVKVKADWQDKPTDNFSCDFVIVHLTTD